jgi:hypothetical protein
VAGWWASGDGRPILNVTTVPDVAEGLETDIAALLARYGDKPMDERGPRGAAVRVPRSWPSSTAGIASGSRGGWRTAPSAMSSE